jgi:hypothetical protein
VRLALVAVVVLTGSARADDCPAVDDPDCVRSMACCTYKYCGANWDLRRLKIPGCTTRGATSTECSSMKTWLANEERILDAYADQRLVVAAILGKKTIDEYQDDVARKAGTDTSGKGSVMRTNRECEILEPDEGCAWLRSKGLPASACEMALRHERLHVKQCEKMGPPSSIIDASLRELIANVVNAAEISGWIAGNCGW